MYAVKGFTGESQFWNNTHPLSAKNTELWEILVPRSGKAETEHGELLRSMNRLVHDVFNNGLCNDKRPEIANLLSTGEKWMPFLKGEEAVTVKLLEELDVALEDRWSSEDEDLEDDYDDDPYPTISMDQENCDRLDDIAQAVTCYCLKAQKDRPLRFSEFKRQCESSMILIELWTEVEGQDSDDEMEEDFYSPSQETGDEDLVFSAYAHSHEISYYSDGHWSLSHDGTIGNGFSLNEAYQNWKSYYFGQQEYQNS